MKVLVTGGTGFTGRRVVRELARGGHEVRCLVRAGGRREVLAGAGATCVNGDLDAPDSIARALEGCEALVNVASIGFGHAPAVVGAAESSGVGRAVFFSTTAVFTTLPAPSRAIRLHAEDTIRGSRLDWTILRPTMIYGAPGDRNVERLFRAISRWPALPVVGRGDRRVQPVLVDDLATAVGRVLDAPRAVRRTYSVPGRAPVTFAEFVAAAGRAAGRRVRLVPVPAVAAVAVARLAERSARRPRVKAEQVLRLLEHKDFEWSSARDDFGYDPRSVEEGLALEAHRLGLGRTR